MIVVGWLVAAGVLVLIYFAFRAFVVEPFHLEVKEIEVHVTGLPPALDGLRLAHVSDLHLRGIGDVEWAVIHAVRSADPDLLCLTGDYLGDAKAEAFLVPFLMEMCQGRRSFAVLGNHDHGDAIDTEALRHTLQRSGAVVLSNAVHRVVMRDVPIYVAGVDDPHTGLADVQATMAQIPATEGGQQGGPEGVSPDRRDDERFVLLLAHSPDVLLDDAAWGADLVLAGHTHGGQICLPGIGPLKTNTRIGRRAVSGLVRLSQGAGAAGQKADRNTGGEAGEIVAHVSRGVGTTGPHARLYCRPEVTILTLRRGA